MATRDRKPTPVQSLATFLKCPYCACNLVKPLIQYPGLGYYVCKKCTRKLGRFPAFQLPAGGRRDLLIEQLCFDTAVKCSYWTSGCQFVGTTILIVAIHEHSCGFALKPNIEYGDESNTRKNSSVAVTEGSTILRVPPGQSLEDVLLAEMNCPVCLNRIPLPIKECENGHRTCLQCFRRLEQCSVCRGSKSPSSSKILEYIYMLIQGPSKKVDRGCLIHGNLLSASNHEKSCEFN